MQIEVNMRIKTEERIEKIIYESRDIQEELKELMMELEEMGIDENDNLNWIEDILDYELNKCKYCSGSGCRDCLG